MSDPLRTDGSRAFAAASEADRDAKIEQLLLAGLDHYFAAEYDHAISVWTRVLFLDRSHARARAYIERARSALAERQRESEELLQNGVAAFERGDGGEARRLVQAAIEGGAPTDEALAVLDRLDRLETSPAAEPPSPSRRARTGATPAAAGSPAGWSALSITLLFVLALAASGAYSAAVWGPLDWRSMLPWQTPAGPGRRLDDRPRARPRAAAERGAGVDARARPRRHRPFARCPDHARSRAADRSPEGRSRSASRRNPASAHRADIGSRAASPQRRRTDPSHEVPQVRLSGIRATSTGAAIVVTTSRSPRRPTPSNCR